jgi:hypothetical protein
VFCAWGGGKKPYFVLVLLFHSWVSLVQAQRDELGVISC